MASAYEEKQHPTIFKPETLISKGLCTVSKTRTPKTHRLYYEVHGDRDEQSEKIVFVMGLNNSCFGWSRQVDDFGARKGYQVLVFDNRGVGNSDSPSGLYKTSEMAKDVIELLDHVGWTDYRGVHVVGVSMGGMIAQEMALIIPDRIASLSAPLVSLGPAPPQSFTAFMSTKAGNKKDLPPRKGFLLFARLLTGTVTSPEAGVKLVADALYPAPWLDRPDPEQPGRTKRETVEEDFLRRFNLARRQPFSGRIGQLNAALLHSVSIERLGLIAAAVPKILVLTGDDDNLINPERSKDLHNLLPGSEYICIKGGGHALPSQCYAEVNEILTRVVKEGRERSATE